jgi:hypothetical protein
MPPAAKKGVPIVHSVADAGGRYGTKELSCGPIRLGNRLFRVKLLFSGLGRSFSGLKGRFYDLKVHFLDVKLEV